VTRRLLVADSVRDAAGVAGDAVLVDGPRIVAVGTAADLRSPAVAEDRYPGATIVPGLRDAHLHPIGHAAALHGTSLKAARDFAELADLVRDAAAALPAGTALTALRLDDETLAEGRLPDRDLLDRIAPDRPVLLVRYCGHVAVANSAALAAAGIDEGAADPTGGSMDRDAGGRLTGVLRETAVEPVTAALAALAPAITSDQVVAAATALAGVGLTGVGAMVSTDAGCWAGGGSELDVLLDAASRLPVTMGAFVIAESPAGLERAAGRIAAAGGGLRFAGVKIFSDGSLGGHTAAMHDGFSDLPSERGTDRLDPAGAADLCRASLRLGGRVAIHAIGDRANAGVLDLMEGLVAGGADPAMLRIEHASVLTESDVARFGRLGITASVQPAFLASEVEWLEHRVGPDRLRLTYPFRSLAAAGAPLAGGSDSPVEPPDPLPNMAAARDRCGIVPDEGLSPSEALAMFTTGAAAAIGEQAGFAPGAPASFTVLDGDPVTASPDGVRGLNVLDTWVAGRSISIPAGTPAWTV